MILFGVCISGLFHGTVLPKVEVFGLSMVAKGWGNSNGTSCEGWGVVAAYMIYQLNIRYDWVCGPTGFKLFARDAPESGEARDLIQSHERTVGQSNNSSTAKAMRVRSSLF